MIKQITERFTPRQYLAELLLKIKQHRYNSKLTACSGAAKYKAIVFVTLESLVYRPDQSQIIYYDDAGYGDILDKNGSRYITSKFKYKDTREVSTLFSCVFYHDS